MANKRRGAAGLAKPSGDHLRGRPGSRQAAEEAGPGSPFLPVCLRGPVPCAQTQRLGPGVAAGVGRRQAAPEAETRSAASAPSGLTVSGQGRPPGAAWGLWGHLTARDNVPPSPAVAAGGRGLAETKRTQAARTRPPRCLSAPPAVLCGGIPVRAQRPPLSRLSCRARTNGRSAPPAEGRLPRARSRRGRLALRHPGAPRPSPKHRRPLRLRAGGSAIPGCCPSRLRERVY